MPQVMIGLSGRDMKTTSEVWRVVKRSLNPEIRRRIGWRGRGSLLRQFILYGFERASENPSEFLRHIRDLQDPLFGKRSRAEAGADAREALVANWAAALPASTSTRRRRGRGK
ncbi:MAG TPA: hypothetical protein VGU43_02550 [Thermoplasmata archaeon]|nr:hypothetical protein [Thermoplasmata archaeon]